LILLIDLISDIKGAKTMNRFALATLTVIALFVSTAASASTLTSRFEDAREGVINQLGDRQNKGREQILNSLGDKQEQGRKQILNSLGDRHDDAFKRNLDMA
jgi:hypothetical protein